MRKNNEEIIQKEQELIKSINNLNNSINQKKTDIEELEVTPKMKFIREQIKVLKEKKSLLKKDARKDPAFMSTNEIILSLGVALMITSLIVIFLKNPVLYAAIVIPTTIGAIKFRKNINWILKYFITDVKMNRLSVINNILTKTRKNMTKKFTKEHYNELHRYEKIKELNINELVELKEKQLETYNKEKERREEVTTLEKAINLIDTIVLNKSFKKNIEDINNVSLMLSGYVKTLDIPVQLELTERIAFHYENAIKLAIESGDLDKMTLRTIHHSYITNILLNNGLSVKEIKESRNITDTLIKTLQKEPVKSKTRTKQR